jgi:hypothetical protein
MGKWGNEEMPKPFPHLPITFYYQSATEPSSG